MTKINITLPINSELFEELRQLTWKESKQRQIVMSNILRDLWTYTSDERPTAEQADLVAALNYLSNDKYYHPIPQESLTDWLINEIYDAILEQDEDAIERSSDNLAWPLFESPNLTGSYTYSIHKARQWIADFASDLAETEISSEIKWNPIDEPEKYQVCAIIILSDRLFQSELFQDVINDDSDISLKERLLEFIQNEIDMDKAHNIIAGI